MNKRYATSCSDQYRRGWQGVLWDFTRDLLCHTHVLFRRLNLPYNRVITIITTTAIVENIIVHNVYNMCHHLRDVRA